MGYKLKRILIYPDGVTEKQVYPGIITETITIPQVTSTSGTTNNTFIPINKSGYKVTQIVIETTGASNSTSNYGNISCGISITGSWNTTTAVYRFARGVGANNYSKIEYFDTSFHDLRTNLGGSQTGTNTVKLTIGLDSGSITLNGTTTTWTTTSTEKNIIQSIFESSTINALVASNRGYTGPSTYTITYKPN